MPAFLHFLLRNPICHGVGGGGGGSYSTFNYCYTLAGKAKGFPDLLYFGKCAKIDCLVMELLGPNLEELA